MQSATAENNRLSKVRVHVSCGEQTNQIPPLWAFVFPIDVRFVRWAEQMHVKGDVFVNGRTSLDAATMCLRLAKGAPLCGIRNS